MPEAPSVIGEAVLLGVTVVTSASLLQGRIPPQKAIDFVRSTPGITTALIGMSRVEHVEENLATDWQR
jgi:aryl-alcohol dehydrogenase-like predicted oxidoreductase